MVSHSRKVFNRSFSPFRQIFRAADARRGKRNAAQGSREASPRDPTIHAGRHAGRDQERRAAGEDEERHQQQLQCEYEVLVSRSLPFEWLFDDTIAACFLSSSPAAPFYPHPKLTYFWLRNEKLKRKQKTNKKIPTRRRTRVSWTSDCRSRRRRRQLRPVKIHRRTRLPSTTRSARRCGRRSGRASRRKRTTTTSRRFRRPSQFLRQPSPTRVRSACWRCGWRRIWSWSRKRRWPPPLTCLWSTKTSRLTTRVPRPRQHTKGSRPCLNRARSSTSTTPRRSSSPTNFSRRRGNVMRMRSAMGHSPLVSSSQPSRCRPRPSITRSSASEERRGGRNVITAVR